MTEYSNLLDILNTKSKDRVCSVVNFLNQKRHDVDSSNIISFYKSYCENLFIKDLKKWNVHPIFTLGEEVNNELPLITEFEFKFDLDKKIGSDDESTLYDFSLTKGLITAVQEIMKEVFFISSRKSEMLCVVLESLHGEKEILFL